MVGGCGMFWLGSSVFELQMRGFAVTGPQLNTRACSTSVCNAPANNTPVYNVPADHNHPGFGQQHTAGGSQHWVWVTLVCIMILYCLIHV